MWQCNEEELTKGRWGLLLEARRRELAMEFWADRELDSKLQGGEKGAGNLMDLHES